MPTGAVGAAATLPILLVAPSRPGLEAKSEIQQDPGLDPDCGIIVVEHTLHHPALAPDEIETNVAAPRVQDRNTFVERTLFFSKQQ
jgi:hypothetical protein